MAGHNSVLADLKVSAVATVTQDHKMISEEHRVQAHSYSYYTKHVITRLPRKGRLSNLKSEARAGQSLRWLNPGKVYWLHNVSGLGSQSHT
ncbi:unnamed protein product [Gulo gulo]|uniref:Uncharacterized protein n=1 Tax=Gulo gulo TaxID=48420 RepID=A0A9X9LGY1_GULGU|nr:unnamed protein product [Gulo gulo]